MSGEQRVASEAKRARWTFSPAAGAQRFLASPTRVFLVGPEPNGDGYPEGEPKDMGHVFSAGLRTRGFGNLKFVRASLLCLEGVLRPLAIPPWPVWWEDLERARLLLDHLLFLDLSAVEGGGRHNSGGMESRVRQYVQENPDEVISHWAKWNPTHTVLLGGLAHDVFQDLVAPQLRSRRIWTRWIRWRHPSANGYPITDLARLQTGFHDL